MPNPNCFNHELCLHVNVAYVLKIIPNSNQIDINCLRCSNNVGKNISHQKS